MHVWFHYKTNVQNISQPTSALLYNLDTELGGHWARWVVGRGRLSLGHKGAPSQNNVHSLMGSLPDLKKTKTKVKHIKTVNIIWHPLFTTGEKTHLEGSQFSSKGLDTSPRMINMLIVIVIHRVIQYPGCFVESIYWPWCIKWYCTFGFLWTVNARRPWYTRWVEELLQVACSWTLSNKARHSNNCQRTNKKSKSMF